MSCNDPKCLACNGTPEQREAASKRREEQSGKLKELIAPIVADFMNKLKPDDYAQHFTVPLVALMQIAAAVLRHEHPMVRLEILPDILKAFIADTGIGADVHVIDTSRLRAKDDDELDLELTLPGSDRPRFTYH